MLPDGNTAVRDADGNTVATNQKGARVLVRADGTRSVLQVCVCVCVCVWVGGMRGANMMDGDEAAEATQSEPHLKADSFFRPHADHTRFRIEYLAILALCLQETSCGKNLSLKLSF